MEITSKTVVLTSHSETMKRWNFGIYDEQIAKPVNGYLEFEYLFYGEQEWIVLVLAKANKNPALWTNPPGLLPYTLEELGVSQAQR